MEFCSPLHIKQEPIDNYESTELVTKSSEEIDYRKGDRGVDYQIADDKLTTGKTIHDIISSIRKSKNGGTTDSESLLSADDFSVYDYSQESDVIDKQESGKISDSCGEICLFCGQTFNIKGEMEKHVKLYHGSKADVSNSEFQAKADMSSRGYKCDICFGNYRSIRAFLTHRSSHFSRHKGVDRLQESLSALYGNSFFSAYLNGFQSQQVFVCQSCKSVFRTRDSYAMHMLMRARGESCKTVIDEQSSTDRTDGSPLIDDIQTKRMEENEALDMSTSSVKDVAISVKSSSSSEAISPNESVEYSRDHKTCMYCKKSFNDQDALAMHVMSDHANDILLGGTIKTNDSHTRDPPKSYTSNDNQRPGTACGACNIIFNSKDSLAMHMLWHAKESASATGTVANNSTKLMRKAEVSQDDYFFNKRMKCEMSPESLLDTSRNVARERSTELSSIQNGPYQVPQFDTRHNTQAEVSYRTYLPAHSNKSRNENHNRVGTMNCALHLRGFPAHPTALPTRPNSVPVVMSNEKSQGETRHIRPTSTGALDSIHIETKSTQLECLEKNDKVLPETKRQRVYTQRIYEPQHEQNCVSLKNEQNPVTDRNTDRQSNSQGKQLLDRRFVVSAEIRKERESKNSLPPDQTTTPISGTMDILNILTQTGHGFSACKFCRIIYLDKTLYQLHMGLHNVNNPWQCNVCGKICKDVHEFSSHVVHGS